MRRSFDAQTVFSAKGSMVSDADGETRSASRTVSRFVTDVPRGKPCAVVLVTHGLNLHPDRMLPVCEVLRGLGAIVVRMALRGHQGRYEDLVTVTRNAWLDDFRDACERIGRIRSESPQHASLPVAFVGQSIGALTFTDYLLQPERAAMFVGALFLSPAIALRPKAQVMRVARIAPRRLPIPSASATEDRMYDRLPAGAYRALFDAYSAVRHSLREHPMRLPTTILCDPNDELVSVKGLRRLIDSERLPNARLVTIESSDDARGYGHMAVDEPTMGPANWEKCREHLIRLMEGVRRS